MENGDGEVNRKSSPSVSYPIDERKRKRKSPLVISGAFVVLLALLSMPMAQVSDQAEAVVPVLMNPLSIPKFVNQITGPPPVYVPTVVTDGDTGAVTHEYRIEMNESIQQVLPAPLPMTQVWGYGGLAKDSVTGAPLGYVTNSPGPSFEATKGIPINVEWVNNVESSQMFAVDPTLHWADPNGMGMPTPPYPPYPPGFPEAQYPVPLVTHLHGGEVQSTSDGHPDAWWTWNGVHGSAYNTERATTPNAAVYHYPNEQLPTTLWYHDHALGITRLNVMSGLAGFYLLRDVADPIAPLLPSGKYEVPLVFQDRIFNADGSFFFPTDGVNPDDHPYWAPEFFGDTIMVNGLIWPNMNVDKGQYMFRLLDGSNARFYTMYFSNFMPFKVIGTDGGYLRSAVTVNKLTIAPGERYVVLVDFSNLAPGAKVKLLNSARAPFPNGDLPIPATTGTLMQFTVNGNPGFAPKVLPLILNPTVALYPSLTAPDKVRILTLNEIEGPNGPLAALLNGVPWHAPVSELPALGSTEEWRIVDLTMDTHPIHLHLVQFQVVARISIDAMAYQMDWEMMNGVPPLHMTPMELPIEPYITGPVIPAPPYEQGWKDTVKMHPGMVTIIRARWAPNSGDAAYPFDATRGPGYVWHCHILDHEDNEMMRPYFVIRAPPPPPPPPPALPPMPMVRP
jgi:FtsP/CotA-like multicopper oxidase with cupredoxin domain